MRQEGIEEVGGVRPEGYSESKKVNSGNIVILPARLSAHFQLKVSPGVPG